MGLGILDQHRHHLLRDAPFGLQVEQTAPADPGGILLGPLQIGLRFDDHLQLIGPTVGLLQGRLLPLGREADPVEHPR